MIKARDETKRDRRIHRDEEQRLFDAIVEEEAVLRLLRVPH
jgi:hypothetical protein